MSKNFEVENLLNQTPSANRLHIGIFGKRNSGKSSLINTFTGQEVSIVSDTMGTTTDPVSKPMEINGLGPCLLIDTAGFDDEGDLGEIRVDKTKNITQKVDVAILIFNDLNMDRELKWFKLLKEKQVGIVTVINKTDLYDEQYISELSQKVQKNTNITPILFSSYSKKGVDELIETLLRTVPSDLNSATITQSLVSKEDIVLLVMPQDIQAPQGRLILPQVQTIRDLLDKHCIVTCVTTNEMQQALDNMIKKPKLIITDSQVFDKVYKAKPKESMLTSFSILFSAYKGDLDYYIESAKHVDNLNENAKILIAECCTHAPLSEDIGREKIPRMLRKKLGESVVCDVVSGTDFPKDLTKYDMVVQCGGCMFNKKYVMSRINSAKKQLIPMTNYGVLIAKLTGNEIDSIVKK